MKFTIYNLENVQNENTLRGLRLIKRKTINLIRMNLKPKKNEQPPSNCYLMHPALIWTSRSAALHLNFLHRSRTA